MKFYVIIFALINACTVLKDGGSTSVKKSNEENEFNIPLTIELKDVIWEDSSIVTFVSIHPDYFYLSERNISDPCGEHVGYSGPFTLGNYFVDTCSFYPVKYDWKSQSSYFLIDDFNDMADSSLYFFYQVSINRYCQSNDQIHQSSSRLLRTELVKYSNSLIRRSEKIYATKEWFSMWCEENPGYRGLRIKSKHCDYNNNTR